MDYFCNEVFFSFKFQDADKLKQALQAKKDKVSKPKEAKTKLVKILSDKKAL